MPLTPKTAVLHHIIHLANGGSNTIDNMIFTTRQAHNRKAKFTLQEFCELAWLDSEAVLKRVEQIHANYRTNSSSERRHIVWWKRSQMQLVRGCRV